jgi:hypothetical protein
MSEAARRDFVKAAGAAALAAAGPFSGRVLGANERPVGALIAAGGMGRANLRDFLKTKRVEIAAVCDVYESNLALAVEMTDGRAQAVKDFRRVLDRKDVDFVTISTPDHWHALPTVMACDAGKDVYVEKPLSLTITEGRRMVEAARRNKRVVQVGTRATDETEPPPEKPQRSDGSPQHYPHVVNFIECLTSRALPASDVEIGHRSTSACHLDNIAYKLKRKVTWDGKAERFVDDPEADNLLSKEYRRPWSL